LIPGEYILSPDPVICNENRKTIKVVVKNTSNRPVFIASHEHFFEADEELEFPRERTFGYRLNTPAGLLLRLKPGESTELDLCEFGGKRVVYGNKRLTMGSTLSPLVKTKALVLGYEQGFKGISNLYSSVKAVPNSQLEPEDYFRAKYLSGTADEDTIKAILEQGKLSEKSADDPDVQKFAKLISSKIGKVTHDDFREFKNDD
jgi:urease subunit beta